MTENGPMQVHINNWTFHWRFWCPKRCIGGVVFFGWYAKCSGVNPESGRVETWFVTASQASIKQAMGLIQRRNQ